MYLKSSAIVGMNNNELQLNTRQAVLAKRYHSIVNNRLQRVLFIQQINCSNKLTTTPSNWNIKLMNGQIYLRIVFWSLPPQRWWEGFAICWVELYKRKRPQKMDKIVLLHHLPCLHSYHSWHTGISTKRIFFYGIREHFATLFCLSISSPSGPHDRPPQQTSAMVEQNDQQYMRSQGEWK
jgi:hypothetical protein